MLDRYQTTGTIRDDGLELVDSRGWGGAVTDFVRGPVVITIETTTAAAVRTLQQNKFMWAVFAIIAEASQGDHSKDQIHDLMCEMFLSYQMDVVDPNTGECTTYTLVRGTSKLKPAEHSEFVEHVMAWAANFYGCEFGDVSRVA